VGENRVSTFEEGISEWNWSKKVMLFILKKPVDTIRYFFECCKEGLNFTKKIVWAQLFLLVRKCSARD
jgi:hypothetical protein